LAISQFDTSERLASLTHGPTYVNASFSVLYDHVKDVATRTDQADKITQSGARHVNEAKVAAGDGKPIKDKSTFIGKDGERHFLSYLLTNGKPLLQLNALPPWPRSVLTRVYRLKLSGNVLLPMLLAVSILRTLLFLSLPK
jgi:hypothetical protein